MNITKRVQCGFSMVEVLVSLVIICIGVLGMLALQGRSVQLTQSTVSQSQAVLLANDLLELMRSNPSSALTSDLFSSSSSYYKATGSAFTVTSSAPTDCLTRSRSAGGSSVATADIDCWLQSVRSLLPVSDALLTSSFAICPSSSSGACSTGSSSVVMIQIAWTDKTGACDDNTCIYQLRSEL